MNMKRGHCLDWYCWVPYPEQARLKDLAQRYLAYRRTRGIEQNIRVEGIFEDGEWRFQFEKGDHVILVAYGLHAFEDYLQLFAETTQ